MTTIRAIFNAFAPEYLERYPHLPTSHRKVISALCNCRSGLYGYSLYQCQSCGEHHRVYHACGKRHCPPCQQHQTQQWLPHRLEQQLPGPHFLITFTVPETLRPFIRSHQRIAYHALFTASSAARKRLAKDERFIGTALPGFTGVLHTWGRQLQYHPHIHYLVPGGGLSEDRTTWRPSRAHFFVPVKALSPIYRAMWQEEMSKAGLLEQIDPRVWTIPWNVHSQATPHPHSTLKYLAPYVFKVAISHSRIVSLTDRTVTFTYRQPGSARPRIARLDAIEFIRRFLPHVWPDGLMKVRHFGLLHASCAIPLDTLRLLIVRAHLIDGKPTRLPPPAPGVAFCPTCGGAMRVVMRLWTSNSAFLDTG
jgi:Putative transposase/Transposase zinc-binding domain